MVCILPNGRLWYADIVAAIIYGFLIGTLNTSVALALVESTFIECLYLWLFNQSLGTYWTIVCIMLGTILGMAITQENEKDKDKEKPKGYTYVLTTFITMVLGIIGRAISPRSSISEFPYGLFLSSAIVIIHGLIMIAINSESKKSVVNIYFITISCVATHYIAILVAQVLFYIPLSTLHIIGDCKGSGFDVLYICCISVSLLLINKLKSLYKN